jgi:hypothetical protein
MDFAIQAAILILFLVTRLWQAWQAAALAAFFYWIGLHIIRYPDGVPATTELWLLCATLLLALNFVVRIRRLDRLDRTRRRLGQLGYW